MNPQEKKPVTLPVWLYQKELVCPCCNRTITQAYPRYTRLRIDYSEPDFRPHYVSDINPFGYDITVCYNCGYSMLTDKFTEVNEFQRKRLREKIMPKFETRHFPLILTREESEEKYRLAEKSAEVMILKTSEMAYFMLHLAWFYKETPEPEDPLPNAEYPLSEILRHYYTRAAEGFAKAYVSEEFPIRGMNELAMAYLLSFLYYRLERMEDCKQWLKECYNNRELHRKENHRVYNKLDALRQIVRKEIQWEIQERLSQ